MDILQDAMMKDERILNINPHYTEFRVIHHPYVRLPSPEMFPMVFVTVFTTFKRFIIKKKHM